MAKTPITINSSAEINAIFQRAKFLSIPGKTGTRNHGRCSKSSLRFMSNLPARQGAVRESSALLQAAKLVTSQEFEMEGKKPKMECQVVMERCSTVTYII